MRLCWCCLVVFKCRPDSGVSSPPLFDLVAIARRSIRETAHHTWRNLHDPAVPSWLTEFGDVSLNGSRLSSATVSFKLGVGSQRLLAIRPTVLVEGLALDVFGLQHFLFGGPTDACRSSVPYPTENTWSSAGHSRHTRTACRCKDTLEENAVCFENGLKQAAWTMLT